MTRAVDTADQRRIWSVPTEHVADRIQWRFVAVTWALAAMLSLAIIALGSQIAYLLTDSSALVDGGLIYIIAVFSTFLSFVVILSTRLLNLESDRLMNSMTVAAVHSIAALVIALFGIGIEAYVGTPTWLTGGGAEALGMTWVAFERTAAASIVACLLAAAIIPASGGLPDGTQTEIVPTDRQL